MTRFVVRPDPKGFRIIDTKTGEPATIAMAAQVGLLEDDALHTANLLNQRTEAAAKGQVQADRRN